MSLSDILKNLGITTKNTIISGALNAISKDNKCGPNNNNTKCPNNLCCSSNGWCGNTNEYCVNSVYKSYDGDIIDNTKISISTDNKCGINNNNTKCSNGVCCSTDS